MQPQTPNQGDEPKNEPEEQEKQETPAPAAKPKKRRGFAAMDRALVRAIARKGGVAAHARGTAHRFTKEEAKEAGRRGGKAPHRSRGRRARPPGQASRADEAARARPPAQRNDVEPEATDELERSRLPEAQP